MSQAVKSFFCYGAVIYVLCDAVETAVNLANKKTVRVRSPMRQSCRIVSPSVASRAAREPPARRCHPCKENGLQAGPPRSVLCR